MQISPSPSVITLNLNELNSSIKKHRLDEWIKKRRIQLYMVYKIFTLGLKTHTDWKWKDGRRYSILMVTERE